MPQILLSKELTVNLGKDEHGQQKTVKLPAGLQEVSDEIADHWFVKEHSQEITASDADNKELQDAYDALKVDHEALIAQSDEATKKIIALEKQAKADAVKIAELEKAQVEQKSADDQLDLTQQETKANIKAK
ncbi:STY1053 family phage-associated protein [Acinetobacter faecalis]|uniref:STY1053 family phage-associated protein n=1 Tax=Acinetobacter faecalis TaxID=2665161 RepID=UPI002A9184CB|nr:hypothetical protein [Acinetobacter faecalis]MDY6450704.1 hypothetical protein [Acinetobacter faecalis]